MHTRRFGGVVDGANAPQSLSGKENPVKRVSLSGNPSTTQKSQNDNSSGLSNTQNLKDGQFFIASNGAVYRHYFEEEPRLILGPKGMVNVDDPARIADTTKKRHNLARLKLLIKMRDLVREILHLQQHYSAHSMTKGYDAPWVEKQRHLQEDYNAFVHAYGPVFKYKEVRTGKIDESGLQNIYRDRVNLKKFRKDPDALLLALVENYDDLSRRAVPGAIFSDRLLVAKNEIIDVSSPQEALEHCLSEKACVDIPYITGLLQGDYDEASVAETLVSSGLIYRDPAAYFDDGRAAYVMRDVYLSGNVRAKYDLALRASEQLPEFAHNVNALAGVLPKDLRAGEIDVALGAPWIPVDVIADFAHEELGISSARVFYYAKTHGWFVTGDIEDDQKARQRFGTEFADSKHLLESALNGNKPSIRRRKDDNGYDLDQEAERDLAADRQHRICSHFKDWIWDDPKRRQRISALYNNTFNAIAPGQYDGAHLKFPGAAVNIDPRDIQSNAAWRNIVNGNTLLGHAVGAGKTFSSIWAAMEKKRLGQIEKPGFVVMNHMLGQFTRDFKTLYPASNILVLHEDQLEEDGQKLNVEQRLQKFIKRASDGNWDAVFMTQSAFDALRVSPTVRLQKALDEYLDLAGDYRLAEKDGAPVAMMNIIMRKKTQKRLQVLNVSGFISDSDFENIRVDTPSNELTYAMQIWDDYNLDHHAKKRADKTTWQNFMKDNGVHNGDALFFEDSLIDYLFIDEGHAYKNLPIESRIAGMSNSGSACAVNLDEKLYVLKQKTPDNFLTMMTATYVSNTISEFFVDQYYLQPQLMKDLGIETFDAWAAMFGEMISIAEMVPEGGAYRVVERMARYKNLPELMRMVHSVLDVVTKAQTGQRLPALKGGQPEVIRVEQSPLYKALSKDWQKRAQKIRSGAGADYGAAASNDNMLKIVMESTLASLHPGLLNKALLERLDLDVQNNDNGGKLDALADQVAKRYFDQAGRVYYDESGNPDPLTGSAQIVFSDLGVPKGSHDFSVYEELRKKLVARGLPKDTIQFVHEYGIHKKEELFEKVRSGQCRVVMGSTEMLGTGSNIQKRLSAAHHLDAPWRPMDLIQRNGRVERQGNQNEEYEELYYVVEGSIDVYRWQTIERKSRFIGQIMSADYSIRSFDEADEMVHQFSFIKNIAANDPLMKEKAEIEMKLDAISRVRLGVQEERGRRMIELRDIKKQVKSSQKQLRALKRVQNKMDDLSQGQGGSKTPYPLALGGREYFSAARAGHDLRKIMRDMRPSLRENNGENIKREIGRLYGMPVRLEGWAEIAYKQVKDKTDGEVKPKPEYKYYYKVTIADTQAREVAYSPDDLKDSKDEIKLRAAFKKAKDKKQALSDEFIKRTKCMIKKRNAGLAERLVAPYVHISSEIERGQKDLSALIDRKKYLESILAEPDPDEALYKRLSYRYHEIEDMLENGRRDDGCDCPVSANLNDNTPAYGLG